MPSESESQNPYEPFDRASDGKFVRRSELEAYEVRLKSDPVPQKDYTIKNPDRRNFLKKSAIVIGGAVAGRHFLGKDDANTQTKKQPLQMNEKVEERKVEVENQKDSSLYTLEGDLPVPFTPKEQLEKFGEIKDLKSGLVQLFREHYRYLSKDPSGKNDIQIAQSNMKKLNLNRFFQPFRGTVIPQEYAYLIAVQETRGRMTTSWAGAKGITGIMPKTAEMLGYTEKDLKDPYRCAEITSVYLQRYFEEFNGNFEMLMHVYNGGRGLFGFTDSTPENERTPERFYAYMQDFINTRYQELKSRGYTVYEVKKGNTLWSIALKHRMLPRALQKFNNLSSAQLHVGQQIKIPVKNFKMATEERFRKSFEVLQYTPELMAKHEVLKEQNVLPA